ncbi:response regulator [Bacillus sp. HNG]|uniref:response regulator transcription factor n=1 Tax=Bacillus sp. HNG TaxID=2293325 RepID=UPI000E2F4BE2|nr:response regulator [Bacillus sp. HNG]RFB12056.1 response regulator [Bacillus sp. HNG]
MKMILLVDDERWVRKALIWTINQLNLPLKVVHECSNGLEALDWVKENQVDLILTDIRMPIMDGIQFVKELNNLNHTMDVVVISVHDEFQFVQQAIRSGVFDYLLKPIDEEELRACLEKWLEKSSNSESKEKDGTEENLPASTIEKVLEYISKTPINQLNLKDAANHVHMNPSYLSQLFKQQLNKKFVDYVTEIKIQEGKKLLVNTTLRMSEIADRLGYADVAYFSNNFKKITGLSPSDYRKINIEQ